MVFPRLQCIPCPAGTFADTAGASSCMICPTATKPGQSTCVRDGCAAGSATFQLVAATSKTHPLAVCIPSMVIEISSACGAHLPPPLALRWNSTRRHCVKRACRGLNRHQPSPTLQPSPLHPLPSKTASVSLGPGQVATPRLMPRLRIALCWPPLSRWLPPPPRPPPWPAFRAP